MLRDDVSSFMAERSWTACGSSCRLLPQSTSHNQLYIGAVISPPNSPKEVAGMKRSRRLFDGAHTTCTLGSFRWRFSWKHLHVIKSMRGLSSKHLLQTTFLDCLTQGNCQIWEVQLTWWFPQSMSNTQKNVWYFELHPVGSAIVGRGWCWISCSTVNSTYIHIDGLLKTKLHYWTKKNVSTLLNEVRTEEVGHGWTLLIKKARSSLIDFRISTTSSQDFYWAGPQFLNQDS